MPVDLPTEHDIVPVDSLYTHGDRENDLEAGVGMMMQEVEPKVEVVTVNRTQSPLTSPMLANSEFAEDAVLVPLPDQGDSSSPRSSAEHVGDVDLLSDEGVVLQAPTSEDRSSAHGHSSSAGSSPEELIKSSESEDDAPPDGSIRLVGGGGTHGKAEDTPPATEPELEEEDNDLVEIQSVHSVASIDSKKAKKGKHKRGKSSISKVLGVKRKKGSTSNTTAA